MEKEISTTTFKNQYNFRIANQIQILRALQSGPKYINELATMLGISFTAINNIVLELESNKIVKLKNKRKRKGVRGRSPSLVSIDTDVGVTCSIDLSSINLHATINDLNNNIIVQRTIQNVGDINKEHFYKLAELIKEMLVSSEVKGRPLLYICISTPGLINKETNDYTGVFRIKCIDRLNPKIYFANEFNVPVKLYNDIQIGCVAEKIFGVIPKEASTFLYIHLGSAPGTALNIDGKLYRGSHGYVGEVPTFFEQDDISKGFENYRLVGTTAISNRYHAIVHPEYDEEQIKENELFIGQIVDLCEKKDKVMLDLVEKSTRYNALQIITFQSMLDVEYIVIEGPMLMLGEEYKAMLLKYIDSYKSNKLHTRVLFSNLGANSSLLGAIHQANNLYFLSKLESITNMKSSNPNYEINEFFGDNI